MAKVISICGLDCAECPAYLAYVNDDDELRAETAKKWSKAYAHSFKPEDVNCVNCLKLEGPHIGHCSECEIRACGMKKGVANCALCDEYACEKLVKFFEMCPSAKEILDEIRATH
ncbi:DUF3795 domain-containing protein [candidate division WOR-3 bacterium]|nr:DUF3795 domain-containing protein [candidate division WOR-3 bacterium]